ncbi:HpcH/HpaI aldolase/citrate lyase family protein [Halomonas alkalisoli]|uniref:HpcH/HpaI aldolase/citrate lyase family protein n=1 Tax=Halomonas alkalisoli TaxID=2907158 RepID=UPI001F3075CF|nr:CoA ester lyase [Halomonas alkalisoli]MCE9683454.1 CoA ester lyase [Halomonas alkalisoli]
MTTPYLRSLLFVPASCPDRIPKALNSQADTVIVDLEDAVAEDEKASAREYLNNFLVQNPEKSVVVRINAHDSSHFKDDLSFCTKHHGISAIMVPKTETCQALEFAARCKKPIWPLIETAAGLNALSSIVYVSGVERLIFGALDMCADLGLATGTPGAQLILDQCRYQLLIQSRVSGLKPPIDSVHPAIEDTAAVRLAANHAREMGFAGMLCIHPKQLAPIHHAFMPDETELCWARRVIDGSTKGRGVFYLDGEMVDAPVIARARHILSQANDIPCFPINTNK